jgi:hypothetical protein
MFPTFQMLLCMLSSFVLCAGYVYLLLVACMPAFVLQNGRRLTHSNFLTHLAWIVQPHEYLKKSVDLDNSDFKLRRDLEEQSVRTVIHGQEQMYLTDSSGNERAFMEHF